MSNLRLAAHRRIGFTGEDPQDLKEVEQEVKKTFKAPIKKSLEGSQSMKMFDWLDEHKKFLSINAICKEIGIDTSNFEKLRKRRGEIPEQFIDPLTRVLEMYGYSK